MVHLSPQDYAVTDLEGLAYSPPRRGGVARQLNRSWRAGVVSSTETFRRSDHPVCAFASLGASTPPRRGVSRAVLLASAITARKSTERKQRTYRSTSLRGEWTVHMEGTLEASMPM